MRTVFEIALFVPAGLGLIFMALHFWAVRQGDREAGESLYRTTGDERYLR